MSLFAGPQPPGWSVPWPELEGLSLSPRARRVGAALAEDPRWREAPADDRAAAFDAALLLEAEEVDAGQSARRARVALWRRGAPLALREQRVSLLEAQRFPRDVLERDDAERRARALSLTAGCRALWLLARADAGAEGHEALSAELFAELCREQGCLSQPFPYPNDHTRFLDQRGGWSAPRVAAHDPSTVEVVLLSGLPGAGKDRWAADHWPHAVVSLDALRAELGVDPRDEQGAVVSAARERAREHLRRGEPFCWNGTNVTRRLRRRCVDLFADYGARTKIVYLEADEPTLRRSNRERPDAVPEPVLDKLLAKWEVPDPTEAHAVEWVVRD